ncbi:MAG TPA: hypothetical protein VK509_09170, partial [Polyangiales bacterium]|nr:hypothetical protein [Polyangiales bacterium]
MRAACILACSCLLAGAASAQDASGAAPASTPSTPAPKLLLLPAYAQGVDPVVASFVDRGLQRGAAQHGYAQVPDASSAEQTAVPAGTAVVPSMVELWQRVHVSGADYAVIALVSAREGRYALELRVACRDGRGPYYAHAQASNVELEQTAVVLLASALPGPVQAPSPGPSPIQNPVPIP